MNLLTQFTVSLTHSETTLISYNGVGSPNLELTQQILQPVTYMSSSLLFILLFGWVSVFHFPSLCLYSIPCTIPTIHHFISKDTMTEGGEKRK